MRNIMIRWNFVTGLFFDIAIITPILKNMNGRICKDCINYNIFRGGSQYCFVMTAKQYALFAEEGWYNNRYFKYDEHCSERAVLPAVLFIYDADGDKYRCQRHKHNCCYYKLIHSHTSVNDWFPDHCFVDCRKRYFLHYWPDIMPFNIALLHSHNVIIS